MENGGSNTRSVLECGGPPPLSDRPAFREVSQSAGGLAQSKTWRSFVAFCLLPSAFCLRGWGHYAIDWSTIDGGGGTSTSGVYSVTGTIGQPDAGAMTGGGFTLAGGYWSIVAAVQTPGAPLLSVARTVTNSVVVSWSAPAEGWLLYATTNLVTPGSMWTEIAPPYQTNGLTNISFTEPPPAGNKFFRLHKP